MSTDLKFRTDEERNLWTQVFNEAIKSCQQQLAEKRADQAVLAMRQRTPDKLRK